MPFRSDPLPLKEILRRARIRLAENPALVSLGVVGIVLGLLCLVVFAARGGVPIGSEGDLAKPATFDIAIGIYVLTLALLLPSAKFSARGRRRWVGWMIGLLTYGYTIETVQSFRGLDPRFSKVGAPVDHILGGVFFLTAFGVMVLFILMASRFFRGDRDDIDSELLLALKYGSVTALGAFTAGIWMSVNAGRLTGQAGNILPLHALGFHGLQAVPVVALLLIWAGYNPVETRKWVHITGLAWLGACAAVAVQTIAGRSIFEISPTTLAAAFLLAIWGGAALFAFWHWARRPATPPASPGISRTPTVSTQASPPRR